MVDDEEDEMQSEQLPDKVKEMIARSGKNPITLFSELFTKVRKIHNQQNGYLYLQTSSEDREYRKSEEIRKSCL